MSEIEKALGGKIKPKTDNLILTDDSVPISLEATPQQFLDAIQDDIGFADLYKLKKQLANDHWGNGEITTASEDY